MSSHHTCGACGLAIETCPDCGGLICSDGCPDRAEDGCVCMIDTDSDPAEG
ncbi:hypothetical protein K8942_00690 [Candidatus Peribacteria bacterium]|nr:MAG: hypothetical protein K8942_00690 [Candidatus Peribacteria bacterium]